MSDDNDFIEKVSKTFERWTGTEWSPEASVANFAIYGKAKRIEALEQIDQAVKEMTPTSGNLRRYSQLTALQRDVETLHQRLIKEGR
jgi:hypothetical protein